MDVVERIKELLDQRGWSIYKLAKQSGIPQSTLRSTLKRNTIPTTPTLEMICSGFGISLSEFYAAEGQAIVLSDEQHELLNAWNTLTHMQKENVLNLIKNM